MAGSRGDGPGAAGSGGWGQNRPGPDGHHDDLDPVELERLDVAVPDDASALDVDRERWLAEAALDDLDSGGSSGGSVPASSRGFGTPADRRAARKRRLVITAAVVLVAMVTVAISGAIGVWIVGPQASPPPAPLASNGAEPGEIGGLLPEDAVLQNGESGIAAQAIRPAVIALLPASCPDCSELLTSIAPQVGSFGASLVAVGGESQSAQLGQLSDAVGASRLVTLVDREQRLREVYGSAGITLLLVRTDGVVVNVVRNAAPGLRLEGDLVNLVPGVGYGT